jgi:hypothetical protein
MNETATVDRATAQAMIERALGESRQEFGSFFLSRLLGFEVSFKDKRCIVEFEATRALFNPQGTLHGGILATAMDVSMGHLLQHDDRSVPGADQGRPGTLRSLISAPRALDLFTEVGSIPGRCPGRACNRDLETAQHEVKARSRRCGAPHQ